MQKKTGRKKWVEYLDKLSSKTARDRDEHRCIKCGGAGRMVHHIFSRRYMNTRFDTRNLITVCYPCHLHFFHSKVEEARDWLINKIGEKQFNELKIRALLNTKPDFQLIKIQLESESTGFAE